MAQSTDNFKITLSQSGSSSKKKEAFDSFKNEAKGQDIATWCRRYGLQVSVRYQLEEHGEVGGAILSDAWAAKMQYYYTTWVSSGDSDYVFTDEDHLQFEESNDFKQFAHANPGRSQPRIKQIRDIQPCGPQF